MSKAFTRESDDEPEMRPLGKPAAVLPAGAPNYLTPDGAERLRKELERLTVEERPPLQLSEKGEASSELRRIDQRIREISETLQSAEVVSPPRRPWDQVTFGAIVTARKAREGEVTYRIVGVDEVDLDRGWVSWLTPVARALMNARLGERVPLELPGGHTELEILNIAYPEGE
ncbi:MAG TPA: GreA/GreB family elongation factor [Chthoniobacteraceae bacterium]|nr:GreA/GreB family elongation factor [Chthoniobacteraceae bacterium]